MQEKKKKRYHARGLSCDPVHSPAIRNIFQLLFNDNLNLS